MKHERLKIRLAHIEGQIVAGIDLRRLDEAGRLIGSDECAGELRATPEVWRLLQALLTTGHLDGAAVEIEEWAGEAPHMAGHQQ